MNDLDRTHGYDDEDTPPPPSNWCVFGVILGFLLLFIAFALFVTGCACTVSCKPDIPRAIEIIETFSK